MRTQLPLLVCALVGGFMAVQYFVPALVPIYDRINDYLQIVYAFSIVLGVASVLQRHGRRVRGRQKDWPFSLVALACMVLMLLAGFIGGRDRGTLFQNIFTAVLLPVQSTMFALLAFYLASA